MCMRLKVIDGEASLAVTAILCPVGGLQATHVLIVFQNAVVLFLLTVFTVH